MPNRAIDRHEDSIVRVLSLTDEGISYTDAVSAIALGHGLTRDRLDSLVRMWCALAGIEVPS